MEFHWKIKLFAGLQERLAAPQLMLALPEEQLTVRELKERLASVHPEHAAILSISFVARNHTYAADEAIVRAEDELALLPPVSGGEDTVQDSLQSGDKELYIVTADALHSDDVLRKVITKDHGASIVFVGTTREWTQGQQTVRLEYEAYEPMAVAMMRQIGDEIAARWPGALCAISHRTGIVELAEISVVIAVSAPHRESCYEASRYAIERLKQVVPIWKKEIWADGSEWKGHQQGPWNPTVPLPE
ncbi:molybdopterin converting factor [Paenibacillus sp. 1011MAR3C5]|uniref:molybdenum cofactor biosynthesis protein n=1 Tax=Paenibacillus sp. 1011MAR3C5 TaxID=1675787 RepID=UPI000E6B7736|nr:molybdenum cofactor biosynthesis protein MoaE [Paenibacillus sp. 1011MAR3C5]RJE84647.1 molybdopterin converting factor [Paenibacillus sp. 1011MAR3C5]